MLNFLIRYNIELLIQKLLHKLKFAKRNPKRVDIRHQTPVKKDLVCTEALKVKDICTTYMKIK